MLEFFNEFRSNTIAGSGNQHIFTDDGTIRTGRIYYRISTGGAYRYAFLFSNILDSTYSDGSVSHRNMICDPYTVHGMRVGRCPASTFDPDFSEAGNSADAVTSEWQTVTFGGALRKAVAPGEFFRTDPVMLAFEKGDYLCLEITFAGTRIPYMEELIIPAYRKEGEHWIYDRRIPCPGMVGCDRPVTARIGYLGDSITEGIGPRPNSYRHWNALLSERLGEAYSYWNLGIGYARANDMATDSAWLYKAKHNDIAFVALGTNDLSKNYPKEGIAADIERIVDILTERGITVILITLPPFNYSEVKTERWRWVNDYLKTKVAPKVALFFDIVPILRESEERDSATPYGPHPNEEGSALWAEALSRAINEKGLL